MRRVEAEVDATAGFSLIEILIAVSLLGLIVFKAVTVARTSNEYVSQESSSLVLEDRARLVLDRLALVIMSCDRQTLEPILNPGHSSEVNYQLRLGIENGDVLWGPPERITLGGAGNSQILWFESPALPGERRAVWSSDVLALLEGEEVNGVDDNGNGLIDEEGLCFAVRGNRVTIRISLGRTSADGANTTKTVETTVTVRNNPVPT
jgi:prepilin-type N-terminal cleavage/methylation domain-containing protein